MAEVRRVQLTTFPCDFSSSPTDDKSTLHSNAAPSAPASVAPSETEGKGSEVTQPHSTVRCMLKLFESNERAFPEFSYTELVEKHKQSGSIKDGAQNNSDERETPYHEELAAIAQQFENKYGEVKKRKKDRIQDLVDIGYGYDDEDSFIDNSEPYDELVPASLTTKYGGFYVNCGVLQFRHVSDPEVEDFTQRSIQLKPPKKRKSIEGSDKPKKRRRKEGEKLKRKGINVSVEGTLTEKVVDEPKKTKKTAAGPLSVTNMLKKFRRQKEREMQMRGDKGGQSFGSPRFPMCPADAGGVGGAGGAGLADPLLSLIGSTNDHALIQAAVTVDFDIDLDSLLDATEDVSHLKAAEHATEMHPVMASPARADVQNLSTVLFPDQPQTELKGGLVSQPGTLPEGLSPKVEGRIGELKLDPLEQLRDAIDKVMPEQLARFHDNRQAHAQVKSTKGSEEKKPRDQRVNSEDEGEEKFGKRGPQKKFKWNEEIREFLCLVVKAKMDRYENEKIEEQEMEEYLKCFLDNEIKTLWPKGWMQPRLLLRESKKFLGQSSSSVRSLKKEKAEKKMASINSGSNYPHGSAELPDGHFHSASSPEEPTLSLYAEKKPLNQVLTTNANLNVAVSMGDAGVKGLGVEPPTLTETAEKPQRGADSATAASIHSPLDLLAEQALARGLLFNATICQKLKAVAASSAKGKYLDLNSPPFPPAAPQSSPVSFPAVGKGHLFEVTAPPPAQFPGLGEATTMQALADDCTTIHSPGERNHVARNRTKILEEQDIGTRGQM
ncbi:ubinuclein-1-like isoform X1 [Gadus chalcogrammus]|uniref:ubinuclein-1-like isoform X1 n=1 Tax=Gadus chalcogrammus TaxID=1042646 RepID=UPI0024C21EC2|nr:ubinuclein-1-like isoform X1 [Gadus chalcogrammus]